MRITFDLTPLYDHLTGVERYNLNITREVIRNHPENEYVLLFKNEVHDLFKEFLEQDNVTYTIIPACNKLFFIQIRLFKELQKIDADYYIFLSFTSPILFRKQRLINAIHDLTCWDCPETIPSKMRHYYRYTYQIAAKRSWKIITVSKFSQKRICEKYGLSENDVPVIYDGLTDIFSAEPHDNPELKQKYGLPDKYILSLSTIEPRKNLQLLIRAYKELIQDGKELPDLVLAGREGWKLEDIVGDMDEIIKNKIHFTGFIEDEDLPQIYREAKIFVFPSKYEGFGLPIIEAMSQGTLVVCSDAASLPEVAGNVGLQFKSDNKDDLKDLIMEALSFREIEYNEIRKKGIELCKRFSWSKEAQKVYTLMTAESGEI